ncbi:MAG: hypothetical protein V4488_05965 [Pseudomonadota bacterium]
MSLLLPNLFPGTVFAGLFADHCWLQGRQARVAYSLHPERGADAEAMLDALKIMLDERKKQLRKGTRLALVVSDSLAAFAMLPWQEALQRPAELESYANIFFEKQGRPLDATWLLRTEFKRYRSNGIAYGLPRKWVEQLEEIVLARGLQLTSVLPVSAAAYCRLPKPKKIGTSLLMLIEKHRMTSMCFDVLGLQSCDIEPIIASEQLSGRRLLRRVVSAQKNVVQASVWSPLALEHRGEREIIKASLPNLELQSLPHGVWS